MSANLTVIFAEIFAWSSSVSADSPSAKLLPSNSTGLRCSKSARISFCAEWSTFKTNCVCVSICSLVKFCVEPATEDKIIVAAKSS